MVVLSGETGCGKTTQVGGMHNSTMGILLYTIYIYVCVKHPYKSLKMSHNMKWF